jgi:hypothetical protein
MDKTSNDRLVDGLRQMFTSKPKPIAITMARSEDHYIPPMDKYHTHMIIFKRSNGDRKLTRRVNPTVMDANSLLLRQVFSNEQYCCVETDINETSIDAFLGFFYNKTWQFYEQTLWDVYQLAVMFGFEALQKDILTNQLDTANSFKGQIPSTFTFDFAIRLYNKYKNVKLYNACVSCLTMSTVNMEHLNRVIGIHHVDINIYIDLITRTKNEPLVLHGCIGSSVRHRKQSNDDIPPSYHSKCSSVVSVASSNLTITDREFGDPR